jgi:cardiolipin synthase
MAKPAPRRSRILVWLTAVTTAATLTACSGPASLAGSIHTTPTGHVAATVADGAYTLLQEPQAGYRPITDLISHATTSVAITMNQLADNSIEQALIDSHNRGVTVTIVLDTAWHGRTVNQPAHDRLAAAGIAVTWAPAGTIVHEKAIAIDDSTAIVSTANLTSRYYATSRDAMIETTNPADVTAIAATIHSDYAAAGTGRHSHATPAPNLIWSPAARADFIQTINAAQHTLDLTIGGVCCVNR